MAKRVLIVEDDPKNRRLLVDLLALAGLEVKEAENGSTGLKIAQQESFDIIVQDVRLSDMRGTDIALQLRQDPRTAHVPIVFVTASVFGESAEEAKKIPNTFFMAKPIDTRKFTKEILRIVEVA